MAVLHECAYLRLDYCHGRVGRAGYGKRMLSTFRGYAFHPNDLSWIIRANFSAAGTLPSR